MQPSEDMQTLDKSCAILNYTKNAQDTHLVAAGDTAFDAPTSASAKNLVRARQHEDKYANYDSPFSICGGIRHCAP